MEIRRMNAQQTILLVEDDPPLADLIGEILADAGYLVEHAARGRIALERLLRDLPDLLLLDLGLPDIDGLEVCRLARRHSPQIPNRYPFRPCRNPRCD